MQESRRGLLDRAAISAILVYRNYLSHSILHSCRFIPSCSRYAMDAIARYGLFSGGLRAAKRIFRCRPFSVGGFDPAE